jgi:hypothetical protein
MDGFNEGVLNIINKLSYEFFVIKRNNSVKCTCIDFTTKEADPTCKKCLGTGNKITIKKIKGASQMTDLASSMRPNGGLMLARFYYIDFKELVMEDGDIIIDNNQVYYAYQIQSYKSFSGTDVYQKCLFCVKKEDTKILLKNFNEIVSR